MSITLNGTIPGSSSAEVVIIEANGESGLAASSSSSSRRRKLGHTPLISASGLRAILAAKTATT
jgi:hypothetical protein